MAIIGFVIAFTMPATAFIIMHAVSKNKKGIALFGTLLTATPVFITGRYFTQIIVANALLISGFATILFIK